MNTYMSYVAHSVMALNSPYMQSIYKRRFLSQNYALNYALIQSSRNVGTNQSQFALADYQRTALLSEVKPRMSLQRNYYVDSKSTQFHACLGRDRWLRVTNTRQCQPRRIQFKYHNQCMYLWWNLVKSHKGIVLTIIPINLTMFHTCLLNTLTKLCVHYRENCYA